MRTYRPDYLLALAKFLDKEVPESNFNLESWVGTDTYDPVTDRYDDQKEEQNIKILAKNPRAHATCGTTACAFGWAPSVPELKKAGLKLARYGNSLVPEYKGEEGFAAAEELFGIPNTVAQHLFNPDYYEPDDLKNPHVVAGRIRAFISNPVEYYEEHLE